MTDYEREYSYKNLKDQLESGYLDISVTHNKNEMEIVKRAMTALRICEQYKRELDAIVSRLGQDSNGYVNITNEEYKNLLRCNARYEELRK